MPEKKSKSPSPTKPPAELVKAYEKAKLWKEHFDVAQPGQYTTWHEQFEQLQAALDGYSLGAEDKSEDGEHDL